MPEGSLKVQLTDVTGEPVPFPIDIEFTRFSGEPGTGGANSTVTSPRGVTDLTVERIACRGGVGTLYRATASTDHFRPYQFIQQIREGRTNPASDDVELWVKPDHVRDIEAPTFDGLPPRARSILDTAAMIQERPEDRDLVDLQGEALFRALGPLRKACFLNLVTKAASEETTGDILDFVQGLLVSRQDRFFASVGPGLVARLTRSPLFTSANGSLHAPLPGYAMANVPSFKSRDAHANIQVTFMTHTDTGAMAADIDIDEASGIEHGFEVIKNAVFRRRTNPYLIREFMAIAARQHRSLRPTYSFLF